MDVTMKLGEWSDQFGSFVEFAQVALEDSLKSYEVGLLKIRLKKHIDAYNEAINKLYKGADQIRMGAGVGFMFMKDNEDKEKPKVPDTERQNKANASRDKLRDKKVTIKSVPIVHLKDLPKDHKLPPNIMGDVSWMLKKDDWKEGDKDETDD